MQVMGTVTAELMRYLHARVVMLNLRLYCIVSRMAPNQDREVIPLHSSHHREWPRAHRQLANVALVSSLHPDSLKLLSPHWRQQLVVLLQQAVLASWVPTVKVSLSEGMRQHLFLCFNR